MHNSPIILFTYNRLDHLKLCLISLKKNSEAKNSILIIFSDGHKNGKDKKQVENVRLYLKNITGFKKVIIHYRKKNFGLAKNIIKGINKIFRHYEKAIIIEDDLILSKYFLNYMNSNLNLYESDKKVASIHAYCYPIINKRKLKNFFFIKGADCWGWATWRRSWKKYINNTNYLIKKIKKNKKQKEFDFNYSYPYFDMLKLTNKINHSWAIKWYASAFINDMYTLYPKNSYVKNIGNDGSGTNSNNLDYFHINKLNNIKKFYKIKVNEDNSARKEFENFFKSMNLKKNLILKILELFKK